MNLGLVHAALDRGKEDIVTAATELRTTRDRIDRRVHDLLGKGWTGDAAESFLPIWSDWLAGATDAEEGLVAMRELIDAFHRDIRQEDADSQADLDQISAHIIERLG